MRALGIGGFVVCLAAGMPLSAQQARDETPAEAPEEAPEEGQSEPPAAAPAPPPTRAEKVFLKAAAAYRRGDFDTAIRLLEEAYRLSPEPVLLFNLAKAHEGKGDYAPAIDAYERYLQEADDIPDRGAIRRRIATLRTKLASEARASPIPWAIAGVGAAGVVVGGVLGAVAKSREEDALAEPVQLTAAELRDEAEGFALGANIGLVAGGALLAAGLTWGIVDVVVVSEQNGADARLELGIGNVALSLALP
jgi:tetratricopeptide (TPR) repeat protein